jgi:DNA processing protein
LQKKDFREIINKMSYEVAKMEEEDWPPLLKEINDPPKQLYLAGQVPDYSRKFLCVVGSRKFTSYGKEACEYLIGGLRGYPITIVSGLALGIDAIAHRAALRNNLPTIGMPGSGLSSKALHPQTNVGLAEEMVDAGSTLISEMEPGEKASILTHNTPGKKVFWSFPRRNRLMVGISSAVLVIEAGLKSGTLITAKLTTEYNRDLLVVPGSIFSSASEGANMFLRLGAAAITRPEDILDILDLNSSSGLTSRLPLSKGKQNATPRDYSNCSENEIKIIELLAEPLERDELLRRSGLRTSEVQSLLTLLELKGHIREQLGEIGLV